MACLQSPERSFKLAGIRFGKGLVRCARFGSALGYFYNIGTRASPEEEDICLGIAKSGVVLKAWHSCLGTKLVNPAYRKIKGHQTRELLYVETHVFIW